MTERKPYPGIAQGFGLILITFAYSILILLLFELVKSQLSIKIVNNTVYKGIESMLLYIVPGAATYFFARKQQIRSGTSLGNSFKSFHLTVFTLGYVIIFSIGFITELFDYFVPPSKSFIQLMDQVISNDIYSIITAVVAAPVLEELLMRGIILNGFMKRYSPSKSIFWSAIIFGVFHLNPWQGVGAFAIGLLLGWLYWKTNSLLLCILLHAANNATALIMMSVFEDDKTMDVNTLVDYMGMANYMVAFVAVLIIVSGCMLILDQHFKKQFQSENHSGSLPV